MANERGSGMDGTSVDWSHPASQAYLPPRSPFFAGGGSLASIPDNTSFFSNWPKLPHPGGNRRHHQRTPSTSFLPQTPAWVDDLLNDSSDVPPAKNLHRRSSSDSFAFLEAPSQHTRIHDIAEEELQHVQIHNITDEEELDSVCMFSKGFRGFDKPEEEARVSNGSLSIAHSDHDSENAGSLDGKRARGIGGQSKNDSEVQSAEHTIQLAGKGDTSILTGASLDPKRANRILANRQSAQRSRVRKLQYISELERTVNVLQEEVSALSPQVTYLDRHRIILNVDNSAMKQRIAALAQEKLFKEAHNEALKTEVHRLRQLYQQQQRKQTHEKVGRQVSQQHFDLPLSPKLEGKEQDSGSDASGVGEIHNGSEPELLKRHTMPKTPFMNPVGPDPLLAQLLVRR